mgnify:CR=1 FL=1
MKRIVITDQRGHDLKKKYFPLTDTDNPEGALVLEAVTRRRRGTVVEVELAGQIPLLLGSAVKIDIRGFQMEVVLQGFEYLLDSTQERTKLSFGGV